jgi:hypothetical protein
MSADPKPVETAPSLPSVDAPDKDSGLVGAPEGAFTHRPGILSIKELDSAIKYNKATLTHVVMARYFGQGAYSDITFGQRAEYNDRAGPLLEAYKIHNLQMDFYTQDFHLCSQIPAAVALRIPGRFASRYRRLMIAILHGHPRQRTDEIDLVYLPEASETGSSNLLMDSKGC